MQPESYLTVKASSTGEYREKGSRFLAEIFPVTAETDVKEKIAIARKQHPKAVHHCYAYRLGPAMNAYRFSDDREPSGSAGRPIFGVIQSNGLTDVLIIVVRYYGGTQLGIAGLIQAYRTAAEACVKSAILETRKVLITLRFIFPEPLVNAVLQAVKKKQGDILEFDPSSENILICRLGVAEADGLKKLFSTEMPFVNQVQIQLL